MTTEVREAAVTSRASSNNVHRVCNPGLVISFSWYSLINQDGWARCLHQQGRDWRTVRPVPITLSNEMNDRKVFPKYLVFPIYGSGEIKGWKTSAG